MAKPKVLTLEQFVDGYFPSYGLDLAGIVAEQRPLTTRVGTNVRLYDVLEMRARGGSRAGLSKYIPKQVSGNHRIDHLNLIVDPTPLALVGTPEQQALESDNNGPDSPGIPDPSTNNNKIRIAPGTMVRRHGSGYVRKFNPTTGTLRPPPTPRPPNVPGYWNIYHRLNPYPGDETVIWSVGPWNFNPGPGQYNGRDPEPPVNDERFRVVQASFSVNTNGVAVLSAIFRDFSYGFFNVSFAPDATASATAQGRIDLGEGPPNGSGPNPPGYAGEIFTVNITLRLIADLSTDTLTWVYDCGTLTASFSWIFVAT